MTDTTKKVLWILSLGILTGFYQGLLGLGGGIVIIPVLVLFLKFGQKEAQGAALWYIVPTSIIAGALYFQSPELDIHIKYVLALITGSLLGVATGFNILKRIRPIVLKQIFAVALVLLAMAMLFTKKVTPEGIFETEKSLLGLCIAGGYVAGFLSSLLGVGGGVIVIPMLILLGGFDQKTAQGMSLMYFTPTAFLGAMLYTYKAKISIGMRLIMPLILGGIVGVLVGWQALRIVPQGILRLLFVVAMGATGIFYYIRARREAANGEIRS